MNRITKAITISIALIVIVFNSGCTRLFSRPDPGPTKKLSIVVQGAGYVSPSKGTSEHSEGAVVSLTATPDSDWFFSHWVGDVSDVYSLTTTITLDEDKQITAVFAEGAILNDFDDPELFDGDGMLITPSDWQSPYYFWKVPGTTTILEKAQNAIREQDGYSLHYTVDGTGIWNGHCVLSVAGTIPSTARYVTLWVKPVSGNAEIHLYSKQTGDATILLCRIQELDNPPIDSNWIAEEVYDGWYKVTADIGTGTMHETLRYLVDFRSTSGEFLIDNVGYIVSQ